MKLKTILIPLGLIAIVGVTIGLSVSLSQNKIVKKDKYLTSVFNTIDSTAAMGIQADYIERYKDTTRNQKGTDHVVKYMLDHTNLTKNPEYYSFKEQPSKYEKLGINTVATTADNLPASLINPVIDKLTNSNNGNNTPNQPTLFNESDISELKKLIKNKVILNGVFSDRNDLDQLRNKANKPSVVNPSSKKLLSDVEKANLGDPKFNTEMGLNGTTNTEDLGQFYNWFNDPYKVFEAFAESFEQTDYSFKSFTWLQNKIIDKPNPTSFLDYAQGVNNAIKSYVKELSALFKTNIKDKNLTALFIKNESTLNSINKLEEKGQEFVMEQPALHPVYYSDPLSTDLPGFGFSFPEPNKDQNGKYNVPFDNWYEIGSAKTGGDGNALVSTKLSTAFEGTADFIFYFYNSNLFTQEEESTLKKTIFEWSDKKDPTNRVTKMLKTTNTSPGITPRIIPLDVNIMYKSSWGPIGTITQATKMAYVMDYLLNTKKTNDIKTLTAGMKWKPFAKSELNTIRPDKVETVNAFLFKAPIQKKII